jgi:hypothetical protein
LLLVRSLYWCRCWGLGLPLKCKSLQPEYWRASLWLLLKTGSGAIPLLVHLMGPGSPVMVQVLAVNLASALAKNSENAAYIAAAGAIPLLVQFLDPGDGPPAGMQEMAAATLGRIAVSAEDAVTIAASGAIPPLVQLLKPLGSDRVRTTAAGALWDLAKFISPDLAAKADNAFTVDDAGAIPLLVQLLKPGSANVGMQHNAAGALRVLSASSQNAVRIASAGAIPLLLKPGTRADVQRNAGALWRLAASAADSDNADTIATAGAIPPLAQLLRSGADDTTKAVAAGTLEAISKGVAENRAAAAAAKDSADVMQAV